LTTKDVDVLLIVSDSSRRGILSAGRIAQLTDELGIRVGKKCFIINQAKNDEKEALEKTAAEFKLNLVGIIPEDSNLRDFDLKGKPTVELDRGSESVKAAFEIFDKILKDI
jgi:CO dehydrogenase maturation factor